MKKKNFDGIRDAVFWISIPIACALCYTAYEMGPTVEGGQQAGRAFVAAAVTLICYVTSSETP